MFNNQYFLYQFQIENIQKEVAEGLNNDYASKVLDAVLVCFYNWQKEHGVQPNRGGLLSDLLSVDKESEKLDQELWGAIEPWKCAGTSVRNRIDLAFKLWTDNYEPFENIKNEFGLHVIFSVLLLLTDGVENSNSIFRAYDYILHYRQWFLEAKYEALKGQIDGKKLRQNQQMHEARLIASKNKRAKSEEYKRLWNEWAIETKKANPLWLKKQVVDFVHKTARNQNHKMANGNEYSLSFIDKSITALNVKRKE